MLQLLRTATSTLLADKAEHLHNIYGLFTKCEVKIAKKERGQYLATFKVDLTGLGNRRFVIWKEKNSLFLRDPAGNPERANSVICYRAIFH